MRAKENRRKYNTLHWKLLKVVNFSITLLLLEDLTNQSPDSSSDNSWRASHTYITPDLLTEISNQRTSCSVQISLSKLLTLVLLAQLTEEMEMVCAVPIWVLSITWHQ